MALRHKASLNNPDNPDKPDNPDNPGNPEGKSEDEKQPINSPSNPSNPSSPSSPPEASLLTSLLNPHIPFSKPSYNFGGKSKFDFDFGGKFKNGITNGEMMDRLDEHKTQAHQNISEKNLAGNNNLKNENEIVEVTPLSYIPGNQ